MVAELKHNFTLHKQKNGKNSHKTCAAALCNNHKESWPELTYHNFPLDSKTRKKWEVHMQRGDNYFKSVKNRYCCSEHFLASDYIKSLTSHRKDLMKGAIYLVSSENKPEGRTFKDLCRHHSFECLYLCLFLFYVYSHLMLNKGISTRWHEKRKMFLFLSYILVNKLLKGDLMLHY